MAFRGLSGTLTAVGGSIRSIIQNLVAGAVLAHPPTAAARELADQLSQDRQCGCRTCTWRRAVPGIDHLRPIPWTTDRIETNDPAETHHDRVVRDAATGQQRLDYSGSGGSWADFLRRVDDLIDEPPGPGPALPDGNSEP
ncbi:hypothetical protein ACFWMR_02030 [Amycolatopsis thailandensis]|uniref:hypothetical protein n=1 Tax=Amycolatopsis thailandensis TaxID=589330 RepID=UPI0036609660